MAEVREALGIPGIDVETARNFRDKDRMKRILNDAGLPCAQHRLVGGPEEAIAFIERSAFRLLPSPLPGRALEIPFGSTTLTRPGTGCAGRPRNRIVQRCWRSSSSVTNTPSTACSWMARPRWWNISQYHPTPLEVMENPWIQWAVVLPTGHFGTRVRRHQSGRTGCDCDLRASDWPGAHGVVPAGGRIDRHLRGGGQTSGSAVLDPDLIRSRLRPLFGLGSSDDLWRVRSSRASLLGGCGLSAGPGRWEGARHPRTR